MFLSWVSGLINTEFNEDTHKDFAKNHEFYWEPEAWTTDLEAEVQLLVTFKKDAEGNKTYPSKLIPFKIKTREIKPKDSKNKQTKGSDVKILEQMLWQLGISPQGENNKGTASFWGKQGARIASDRNGNDTPVKTKICGGTTNASKRQKYYAGFDNCKKGQVSTELMIRRFQGRNVAADSSSGVNNGTNQTGTVDTQTLTDLKRVWVPYIQATASYTDSKILNSEVIDEWLTEALKVWDEGLGTQANVTYTQAEHEKMLEAAGMSKTAKTRKDLLRSWKANETTSHWGEGSPRTAYRMTEGGADPYGSMSFNQILYQYRYSRSPCKGHKDADLNYFDPIGNLKGFALHTALKKTSTGNCQGAFDLAYALKIFTKSHASDKPIKYYHTAGTLKDIATKDDEYEVFAKAVAAYNGGNGFWNSATWAGILKQTRKPKSGDAFANAPNGTCFSCEYSIKVRNQKYGLPYRTYIWEGKKGTDLNGDGEIKNVAANPTAVPPIPELKEEGWCFAYGEEEWVDGKLFEDIKVAADRYDEEGDVKTQIGAINCSTGNSI